MKRWFPIPFACLQKRLIPGPRAWIWLSDLKTHHLLLQAPTGRLYQVNHFRKLNITLYAKPQRTHRPTAPA